MEDEVSGRTLDQQLFDANDSLYERFVQLIDDADQFLRNAGEVSAQYKPTAELTDECMKTKALLHNRIAVLIREGAETELDKLRKSLDEVLAKPRRNYVDVKEDFDIISEKKRKTDILNYELRRIQYLFKPLDPESVYELRRIQYFFKALDPESVYGYIQFIGDGAEQMKKEYDELLKKMSAEIDDDNLLFEAVHNFNTEMTAIFDLLSKEPTKENIENVEKFQILALRAQLAVLKEKYDEANHARKHVDPYFCRFAVTENRMKSLDCMLQDAKEAVKKNEWEQFLELPEDSLNKMENHLQNLPKETDELERKIAEMIDRSESNQDPDFVRGTSLTHVEDATAVFSSAQDILQNHSSRAKNASKLVMDGHSLKVEVQVRDGPPGEVLVLTHSDAGYCEAKQKFCGFEWEFMGCGVNELAWKCGDHGMVCLLETRVRREAKPTINEDHVAITLFCTPEVETDSWPCAALVTVYACVGVDDETTLLYRSSHVFHEEYRSASIIASHLKLENDDTKGLHSTFGEAAVRDSNFTKPSELSNVCIAFKNTDMRVFVNKEYLLINSRKFATLFTAERAGSAASNLDKSEYGDDFDVLSSRASVSEQSSEDSGLNINLLSSHGDGVPSTANCHEEGAFLLEDVNIKDFITFLETIYPPFKDITGENVESVLPTAFRFDVEHILKKCEVYLGTADAKKLFDLPERLLFATTYKLSSLQKDSLASLQNAHGVLLLLDDPRLQNASPDLRSLLLETLLERFRSEAGTAVTTEADAASTNSDF